MSLISDHFHRIEREILVTICLLIYVIVILDYVGCDYQKNPILNQHHQKQLLTVAIQQQQQQQNQARQLQSNNNQFQRSTSSLSSSAIYPNDQTNATFQTNNRPIERPSLNLISSSSIDGSPKTSEQKINNTDFLDSPLDTSKFLLNNHQDLMFEEGKSIASFAEAKNISSSTTSKRSGVNKRKNNNNAKNSSSTNNNKTLFDDEQSADSSDSNEIFDDVDEASGFAGMQKEPECAINGRFYCTYKEEYPLKLVTEVTKYYKWPLEKLFRDLHAQIMPKLAHDSTGSLVCDSITRVVRPGWARNTNERWLVVINNDNYHQYVTEVVCQYGTNSRCNFIPPCYYSSCQQRYNTQKLLVIDPTNPYRGPFMSEFLFPSCCVCYVPSASDTFQDKYRSSPATIYQRTMQQESANNLYPPQFKPTGLIEDNLSNLVEHSLSSASSASSNNHQKQQFSASSHQALGPGEIRREGEQYKKLTESSHISSQAGGANSNHAREASPTMADFPRL